MTRLTLIMVATGIAVAGCAGHGEYTSAFREDAIANQSNLRAATNYDLATQQFHSGDLERGLETIDNSIALNAGVPYSHLLRGRILGELGRSRDALDAFARVETLDPTNADLFYGRAIVFERIGQIQQAHDSYVHAVELAPNAIHYRLAVAESLIDLGRIDDARTMLTGEGGEDELVPGFRQLLGHIAFMTGQTDEALQFFTEAVLLDANDPVLREDLCRAQISAHRFAEAESTLRGLSSQAYYKQRRDLRYLHASCLIELDRPVEARAILLELTTGAAGTNDIEAWIRIVDVAVLLRDDHLLRTAARHLMTSAPRRAEGFLAQAYWQRGQGDLDGALHSAEQAIDRAGDNQTPRRFKAILERDRARQQAG